MEFVFTGFRHRDNIRQYAFEGIAADRTRTGFVVGADLALLRKYHIAVQEVPLLCRRLLEALGDGPGPQSLMFTEEDMLGYANTRAAARDAAAQKKKIIHRTPPSHRLGQAWRVPGQ